MSLPFPGTVAMLSLGENINAANILGLSLLLFFAHIVRLLYCHRIVKIIPAIVIATLFYGLAGSLLNRIYPMTTGGFWCAVLWNFLLATAILCFTVPRKEPGQKSRMPVIAKIFTITLVVSGLIILKKVLGGFMVAFPMVSLIAMYESRYSLWTMSRQMAVMMMALGTMFTTIFLLQNLIGLHCALGCGWVVFILIIFPLHYRNNISSRSTVVKHPAERMLQDKKQS